MIQQWDLLEHRKHKR